MSLSNAYSQYKQNSILTSNAEDLTLMLYNGLVKFIMQAQKAIEENNIQNAHDSIVRAQDIVLEFISSLDMKYEISNSMVLIYDYMHKRLIDANIKKDNEILEEVLSYAKELRDTWAQAMKIAKQPHDNAQYAAR